MERARFYIVFRPFTKAYLWLLLLSFCKKILKFFKFFFDFLQHFSSNSAVLFVYDSLTVEYALFRVLPQILLWHHAEQTTLIWKTKTFSCSFLKTMVGTFVLFRKVTGSPSFVFFTCQLRYQLQFFIISVILFFHISF